MKKKKYDRSCELFLFEDLLVEDNLEISEVMTVYCGIRKGIDCKVVKSGQEGLERIRNENFDLIRPGHAQAKTILGIVRCA
jgi:hypothetical protein